MFNKKLLKLLFITVLVSTLLMVFGTGSFPLLSFPLLNFIFWILSFLIPIFFTIFVVYYSIKHPKETNLFLKIFFLIGVIFAGYYNFSYALVKQTYGTLNFMRAFLGFLKPESGLHPLLIEKISFPAPLYMRSMYKIFPASYSDSSYLFISGFFFDKLALTTGIVFLPLLIILPSFLALPFFCLWVVFSLFYIFTPYRIIKQIGERIKELLHKRSNK